MGNGVGLSPAPFQVRQFLLNISREIQQQCTVSQSIKREESARKAQVHIWGHHSLSRGYQGKKEIPVMMLDAAAYPVINRVFLPQAKLTQLPLERNCEVTQVYSTRGATSSFLKPRGKETRRLKELNQWIISYAATHAQEKILIGGPQKLMEKIKCPDNGTLVHFNAIRGLDGYKDYHTVMIIGRNQPPVTAVEDLARSLYSHDEPPLNLTGAYHYEIRGYRMRDGRQVGVAVVIHPDARVQAILEQIREQETLQMIDRLRLIHNPTPKKVFLLCNIPLDLTVDRLVSWKELITGGSRLEQAWEREGSSLLILQAKYLSQTFPDLWPTPMSVKMDFHKHNPVRALLQAHPEIKQVKFKSAKAKHWSYCLTSLDDEKTRRRLEKALQKVGQAHTDVQLSR
jgi:hypothetical protein